MATSTTNVSVVIPSWNAKDELKICLDSLLAQSYPARIIVVENGSHDGSAAFIRQNYPQVELIIHATNKGFAGGVNAGIRRSIELNDEYVALFNNDAVADDNWLENLVAATKSSSDIGIVTCKFMDIEGKTLDSTGDIFTSWGLSFPRGRGEAVSDIYDGGDREVFGASGGASLYRIEMLKQIGLFDEDFFAYYEDVDISFRAQLSGWKVLYEPTAIAFHQIGATSGKIKGFTTYQTLKNQPLVIFKNVPRRYMWGVGVRYLLAHILFSGKALLRGQIRAVISGNARAFYLLLKKIPERIRIQRKRTVSNDYIWSIISHDLPPNARALRKVRRVFWVLTARKSA
jgi:GT2 family glycosyltransferase